MIIDHQIALILLIAAVTVTAHIFIDEYRKARKKKR